MAGLFYPDEPARLTGELNSHLGAMAAQATAPRAIIAPHAGYRFSGTVAGIAFGQWRGLDQTPRSCILLGPPHRVPVRGIALPKARRFVTPLGEVALDEGTCAELLELPFVHQHAEAHAAEHSLEVELPFLQTIFGAHIEIVPLLVGDCPPASVARVFERYAKRDDIIFVVSSDLSHFLDYDSGRAKDQRTMERIVSLAAPDLDGSDACGCRAVNGLIEFASHAGLVPRQLALDSSGDHGGPRERVVGYGAVGFWTAAAAGESHS